MKRSRKSFLGSSPDDKGKKLKSEEVISMSTPVDKKKLTSEGVKTSGGISKSLLTPCRRLGLGRNRGKPLKIFSNDKITSNTIEKLEKELKNDTDTSKVDCENTSLDSAVNVNENKKSTNGIQKRSIRNKNSSKCEIEEPKITNIFERGGIDSQDSVISTDGDLENIDVNNVDVPENSKRGRSKLSTSKNITTKEDDESTEKKLVPKVILNKIKSDKNDVWEAKNLDDTGSHINGGKGELKNNGTKTCENKNKQKSKTKINLKKNSTSEKLGIESSQNDERRDGSKTNVSVEVDNQTHNLKKNDSFIHKNNINNLEKTENTNHQSNHEIDHTYAIAAENKRKNEKSLNKSKSDGEILKQTSSIADNRNTKSATNILPTKTSSHELLTPTTSSQSSIYSYQSDDDFEDKTIVERRKYDKSKKSKLQMNISKSAHAMVTQKDIDTIEERIGKKKEKLNMINESPRRGLSVEELQELIKAWRGGCQKALEELLEISKERGTLKNDADMEDLLRALNIPHDLVKYDPDEMVFE